MNKLNLNLATDQKIKFIELLLIVCSLIVAFMTPDNLKSDFIIIKSNHIIILFMIFILFSILYFILIQKELKEELHEDIKRLISTITFIISISFSAILSMILAINVVKDISSQSLAGLSYLLIIFAYLFPITFVIWVALKPK